jgi:transposase-like protein
MRNEQLMRIWFTAWNADIQRARDAYDRREAEIARFHVLLGEGRLPPRCRAGKHKLSEGSVYWAKNGRWRCAGCHKEWQKRQWRKVHPKRRKVGPKKKLSWVRQRELAAKYRDGASTMDLVAEYNVSRPTVLRAVRNSGVPVRGRVESARLRQPKGTGIHLTAEQKQQIVARYNQHENSADLASEFGISAMTVLRTIRASGGTVRSRSESLKISHASRRRSNTRRVAS